MKQQETDQRVSRREFIQTSAAVAAGVAVGLKPTFSIAAGNPKGADTSKILNYNPDMEYRLCGKTGWMISAACLGGHWKRVNNMVP
ncbi:MAG: twin-arginine translocation signal domain-containing protein, partial [Verrucomicrobia bacterium]|nr:twin-arginine translocation signal domain-containing protein [Verrucomicrobiota bacterium]